jgi:LCP family protein required for cell wall assembly
MRHLMSSPDRKLHGEADDRINILLLGMGGEGHEGPNLTDTIIIASVKPSEGTVALLSVPRDLLVPLPRVGWRKVNAANAFGELESPGDGADYARTVFEGLVGLDIPYHARIDFEGFREIIDAVGGVEVYVERSFTDRTYPTSDYGVQAVTFKEGWQTMDGETALRFARSRHGNNGEGSDFARAKRQQKVITALKEKVLAGGLFKSPASIANMFAALQGNVSTNLQIGEILRLARMARDVEGIKVVHKVLDDGKDSPLVSSHYGGAYVLVPKNDDWGALRSLAAEVFALAEPEAPAPEKPEEKTPEPFQTARVEILNGSGKSGAARAIAQALKDAGFAVVKIGNADSFDHEETIVYDLTKGQFDAALARLKSSIGAKEKGVPRSFPLDGRDAIDLVVIIGKDG